METEKFILAILGEIPSHSVTGKKRLQKLVYLLKEGGEPCDAVFQLRNFGPYSSDVEDSTDILSLLGDICEEEERVGYADYLACKFYLPDGEQLPDIKLSDHGRSLLSFLNKFTTVELEIASTILYFYRAKYSWRDALKKTMVMKPAKSKRAVLEKANDILKQVVA